jgi:hypothetical protein
VGAVAQPVELRAVPPARWVPRAAVVARPDPWVDLPAAAAKVVRLAVTPAVAQQVAPARRAVRLAVAAKAARRVAEQTVPKAVVVVAVR